MTDERLKLETRRARRFVALIPILGLVAVVAAAPTAHAADGTASAGSAAAASPVVEFTAGDPDYFYGRTWGQFAPYSIGPATTEIVLDPDIPTNDTGGGCVLLVGGLETNVDGWWTPDEWEDRPSLAVPPGTFAAPATESIEVLCRSGDYGQLGFELIWTLGYDATAPSSIVLDDQVDRRDYSRVDEYYNFRAQEPVTVAAGSTVRVSGPPGTWYAGADYYAGSLWTGSLGNFGEPRASIDEVTVSPDGSLLEYVIPVDIDPWFFRVQSALEIATPPFAERGEITWWHQRYRITPPVAEVAPSSSRIALGNTVALSVQRVRATIVATSPGSSAPTGQVTFTVNGKVVATTTLDAADDGRASVTLPRLPRGTYRVAAIYEGSDEIAGSSTPEATLRILL